MQQCALQFTLSAVTISIRADGRVAESNLLEFTLLCLVAFLTHNSLNLCLQFGLDFSHCYHFVEARRKTSDEDNVLSWRSN